jgi:diaminopimelate epimerase
MTLPKRFTKMSGAGNDFLVFAAPGEISVADGEALAKLCRRGISIGADGALFVEPKGPSAVVLAYYNADGAKADFCANGTRCAARFAHREGYFEAGGGVLETGWGPVRARVDDAAESVTLELPDVPARYSSVPISVAGLPPRAVGISVGVPHLVVVTRDVDGLDLARVGPVLRRHPSQPEGANVHFVRAEDRHTLTVRSFERGVEAETLACGSGVVASAVVARAQRLVESPVACRTRGGAVLTVEFEDTPEGARNVRLTGDARFVFEGEIGRDAASG